MFNSADIKTPVMLKAVADELAATQYQRDREAEYPAMNDLIVALAEKAEGNDTMWLDITAKRQAVKVKHPKP
jgi:hypothetical protein